MTLDDDILCISISLRESEILSSMSTTTISIQRQQSTQKLCSSLHDSNDLHNAHRGIEAPTQKQVYQRSVAFVMAQNRSISNGVARAAYASSLAVNCGLVIRL